MNNNAYKDSLTYICIDLKSYYASVECVYRGLDPLKTNLLVADESRSDQTICLAVSPSLKAKGVPSRPRLFEAKQAIRLWENQHHEKISYLIAVPRMAEYERISAQIYSIYLRYVAPCDIHVYSIDEAFLDLTTYIKYYNKTPLQIVEMVVNAIKQKTGLQATGGIGDGGIDTLPDMENFVFSDNSGSDSDGDDSDTGTDSDFVSMGSHKKNDGPAEVQDAALMAKAISSVLSDENS